MKEWDVYINGKFVGTVHEANEDQARCAAAYNYGVCEDDEIEVSVR